MGDIKLSGLERIKPQVTNEDFSPDVPSIEQYVYKDLKLDLSLGTVRGDLPANKAKNTTDIEDHRDLDAIIQSVKNIFNTTPGQKLLNPKFGVNIGDLLFEGVTFERAHFMAEVISKELSRQEPRATFTNVHVVASPDLASYTVSITAVIPALSQRQINISGVVTTNGLMIKQIDNNTIA